MQAAANLPAADEAALLISSFHSSPSGFACFGTRGEDQMPIGAVSLEEVLRHRHAGPVPATTEPSTAEGSS